MLLCNTMAVIERHFANVEPSYTEAKSLSILLNIMIKIIRLVNPTIIIIILCYCYMVKMLFLCSHQCSQFLTNIFIV